MKRIMIRLGSALSILILLGLISVVAANTLFSATAADRPKATLATPSSAPADRVPAPTNDATTQTATPTPATTPSTAPTATSKPAPTATATPAATPVATKRPTTDKLIVISLNTQSLTAYENGQVVATTVVATGRPALPTPPGTYRIKAKFTPYQFISPWPKGSPYWYASAWVNYAMLFEDGGYFIHDAPWRTVYGPGANLANGTHGCVNVPLATMTFLYKWAPIGTTVIIQ